jgi:hypothetical protein
MLQPIAGVDDDPSDDTVALKRRFYGRTAPSRILGESHLQTAFEKFSTLGGTSAVPISHVLVSESSFKTRW